jgi:O-antigen/teichoic acid export membrane protein
MKKRIKLFYKDASKENKAFISNTFFNIIFIGIKIGIGLVTISILLKYLGEERFGVWQTILSISTFFSLLSFGYSNGLRNLITKLIIKKKEKEISKAIGATYLLVSKIVAISALILLPSLYFFLNPNTLFLGTTIASNEISISILIFLSFFLLNIILSLSESIAFGIQKSYLTSLFQAISIFFSLILVYIIGENNEINLIQVAFIFGLTQSVTYVVFILFQKLKLNININFKSSYSLKETNKLSFHFFIAHLLAVAFLSIDNFIISSTLGAEETAGFSIVTKIFFTLITLYSILLIHFWNSVTEAFEKAKFLWILHKVKILIKISFLFFFAGLLISFFQENILLLWLGENNLNFASSTFYLYTVYLLFHCINAVFVNIQNGLGKIKIQIGATILALIIYVTVCYFIDIAYYGYNVIIIIKIVVMGLSLVLNSFILKKLQR